MFYNSNAYLLANYNLETVYFLIFYEQFSSLKQYTIAHNTSTEYNIINKQKFLEVILILYDLFRSQVWYTVGELDDIPTLHFIWGCHPLSSVWLYSLLSLFDVLLVVHCLFLEGSHQILANFWVISHLDGPSMFLSLTLCGLIMTRD